MAFEKILFDLGAPMLAKLIGQKFGPEAAGYAKIAVDTLAGVFDVEPTREAVEAAVKPNQSTSAGKVLQAEAKVSELVLAQVELMRAGNEQQRQSNELLKAAMDKGPLWTWAWLYVWQYFLMAIWAWTLVLVHLVNAGLRLAGDPAGLPAPDITMLMSLTGMYLGLHMGGHTVLELMRGKWGRADEKWIE